MPDFPQYNLSRSLATGMVHSPALLPYLPTAGVTEDLNAQNLVAQQASNAARIPNAPALEQQSSADIAALLNPPSMFADTNRYAAETSGARGIPGSYAAAATGVRMTDEERLRRIALGENLLYGAYARNPGAPLVSPLGVLALQQQQYNNRYRPPGASGTFSSGPSPSVPLTQSPFLGGSDYWSGSTAGTGFGSTSTWSTGGGAMYPNPSGSLLPLYPGGPTPGGSIDQILADFGLTPVNYNPGQGSPSSYVPGSDVPGTGDAEMMRGMDYYGV